MEAKTMFVRYLGDGVCWTILDTGAFLMGCREDLSDAERALCDQGGGEMPASLSVEGLAH